MSAREIHAGSTNYAEYTRFKILNSSEVELGELVICGDHVPAGKGMSPQHDYWRWEAGSWPAATFRLYREDGTSPQAEACVRYALQSFPATTSSKDFGQHQVGSGERFYVISHVEPSNRTQLGFLHVLASGDLDWYTTLAEGDYIPQPEESAYLEFDYRTSPPAETHDVRHLADPQLS